MVRGRLRNFASLVLAPKAESSMLLRVAVVVCACVLGAASAVAEDLGPEQARAFVVGKLFAYTCFDGTAGVGRIFADGSVIGTIRPGGHGEAHFAALPAGTLKVDGSAMCAHLSGLSRALGCRRSITAASAGRFPASASPIATSISATRAPS